MQDSKQANLLINLFEAFKSDVRYLNVLVSVTPSDYVIFITLENVEALTFQGKK